MLSLLAVELPELITDMSTVTGEPTTAVLLVGTTADTSVDDGAGVGVGVGLAVGTGVDVGVGAGEEFVLNPRSSV